MNKIIYTSIAIIIMLSGCGGGDTEVSNNSTTKTSTEPNGYTGGKYNLWEYVVPSKNEEYSFIEKSATKNRAYNTTYSKNDNIVTEVSDYAQNEKTIYTRKSDKILVEFEKNGVYNGEYSLNLTANINSTVTIKESTCKLSKHYNSIKINDIEFADVIEIKCDGKPGYYQKGKGEIAQINTISTKGETTTRVLTN